MVRVPIPKKLNRNGVRRSFPRVKESTWKSFFDNEKNNGLFEVRVEGPDKYAYYDVEKLMQWLMQRNLYRRSDFKEPGELLYDFNPLNITTHLMAG